LKMQYILQQPWGCLKSFWIILLGKQKNLFNYTRSPEDATYGYISLRQTYTKVLTDIPFNLSYKIEIDKLFNKIVFGKPHYDYNQTTNIREEN
jgi:hypothetical protein